MPSESQEQAFSRSEHTKSENRALTSKPRKRDPMGRMGKTFARVGTILVVMGVPIASLLGWLRVGGSDFGFGFWFAPLAGAWATGLVFLLGGLILPLFFHHVRSATVVDHSFMALVNQDGM